MRSSGQPLRRYLHGVILLSLIFAAIVFYQLSRPYVDGHASDLLRPVGGDFLNYWAAPRIAAAHIHDLFYFPRYRVALHALYPGPIYDHNWSYPLHSLFFWMPFSAFNYQTGLLVWTLTGLLFYLTMVRRTIAPPLRRFITPALLLAPATLVNVVVGQNGLFLGGMALAVLLLLDGRRFTLAGILLGCLTIKPQLFLLWPVMLLARGAWRTMCIAILTAACLIGLSVWLYGVGAWQDYLATVPHLQWQLVQSATAASRTAAATYHLMMLGGIVPLTLSGVPFTSALKLQCILTVFLVLTTWWAFRRVVKLPTQALLLASGGLLATPYAFNYDMTFLTAALVMQWAIAPPVSAFARWRDGAAFLLPLLVYKCNNAGIPLAPVILLAVFLSGLNQARQMPKDTTAAPR